MSIGNLKVEIIKVELQKNIILKEDKILISMDSFYGKNRRWVE